MELTDFLITFLSQLSLLVIGWFLAKKTVSSYQKNKEHKEIRENTLDLQLEVYKKLMEFLRCWNEWIEKELTTRIVSQEQKDGDEEVEDFLADIEEELIIFHNKFEELIIEYRIVQGQLFGRLFIQFKLNDDSKNVINQLGNKFGVLVNTLSLAFEEKKLPHIPTMKKDIEEIMNCLQSIYELIINPKTQLLT